MGYFGATLMQVLTRARHSDVTIAWERNGWRSANDVTHRKRAEDFGNWKKVKRVDTRHWTKTVDFRVRSGETNLRAMSAARDKGQMIDRIVRLCLSPYIETFNSKVIKMFRTWTKKSLRVFEFRDSYVLYVYMLSKWVMDNRCTFPK